MTLRCKHGDLAVIVGEYPGCEANIGRIVQVRGPAHLSEQCGELLLWSLSTDLGECQCKLILKTSTVLG
jgi:hypothetical protein